jgi:hypothetical protein
VIPALRIGAIFTVGQYQAEVRPNGCFADHIDSTADPTEVELTALRDLEARTAAAHGQAPGEA